MKLVTLDLKTEAWRYYDLDPDGMAKQALLALRPILSPEAFSRVAPADLDGA